MYMRGSPQVRYKIIAETISRDDNLLNIAYLCEIAGVSRSGFYYWRSNQAKRNAEEEQDQRDFDLILAAFKHRSYDKGARGIHMRLLHQDPPVIMNTKKIRRLMKKYNLSGEETARILMENSSSCYDFKDGKPCGTCKPCTRKWLAILGATGVDTGQYFDTHPRSYFTPETIEQWIDRESGPNNRGRESEEIITTLKSL